MKNSRYPRLTKEPIEGSIVGYVFDNRVPEGNLIHLSAYFCQGAVLGEGYTVDNRKQDRVVFIVPRSMYSISADAVDMLYTKWFGMLQQINPNLKLYLNHEKKKVHELVNVLGSYNGNKKSISYNCSTDSTYRIDGRVAGEQGINYQAYATSLSHTKSLWPWCKIPDVIKHPNDILHWTDCIVYEMPADNLAGLTMTLARYLHRDPYQGIPQFAIELHEAYGLPLVASIVLAHFGVHSFQPKEKMLGFLEQVPVWNQEYIDSRYDKSPSDKIKAWFGFSDSTEKNYESYYGFIFPQIFHWDSLLTLSPNDIIPEAVVNNTLCPQKQILGERLNRYYNYYIGKSDIWEAFCDKTLEYKFPYLEKITKLINEQFIPVRELSEAGVDAPVSEFLDLAKAKSKTVYG